MENKLTSASAPSQAPKPKEESFYQELDAEMIVRQWIFLIYGSSGMQKTRLGAQFPRPIILAAERGEYGGTISAKEFKPAVAKITTWRECNDLIPKLKQAVEAGTFYTVVVDSITAIQKLCLKQILIEVGHESPQRQDWGLLLERMRTWITRLSEIPAHIVYIALEQVSEDDSNRLYGGPNLSGKLAFELPAAVDITLHAHAKEMTNPETKVKERCFYLDSAPTSLWTAKDCSGTLPASIEYKGKELAFKHLEHLFAGTKI